MRLTEGLAELANLFQEMRAAVIELHRGGQVVDRRALYRALAARVRQEATGGDESDSGHQGAGDDADACCEKPLLLRTKAAARLLSVDVRTVQRWVRGGELRPVRIGRLRLIRREDLDDLIDRQTERGAR